MKKKVGKRLYKKAPPKALLLLFKEKAKKLKRLAYLSFALSILFLFLINPFSSVESLQDLPSSFREAKLAFVEFPQFLKVFPQELEKQTFSFFDWTESQLRSGSVSAKDSWEDKEAGQSALADIIEIDPATLSFSIEIPKLELLETVSSNVNPNVPAEYELALEEGVAHAKGSAFPGQEKLIYIFGHSTNGAWNVEAYNAVFYQIKDLEIGDQVILHLGAESFEYTISSKDVLRSNDIDFVNNKKDQNLLILQTCWPPGTSWQRLFITAEPV